MGVLDTLKGLVGGHKSQADEGLSKGAQLADDKTGGAHSSQINTAEEKGTQEINNLDDGTSTSTP